MALVPSICVYFHFGGLVLSISMAVGPYHVMAIYLFSRLRSRPISADMISENGGHGTQ